MSAKPSFKANTCNKRGETLKVEYTAQKGLDVMLVTQLAKLISDFEGEEE